MLLDNMDLTIAHAVAREEERVVQWKEELAELPEGSLYIVFASGNFFFYHKLHDKRKGISSNEEMIYALARKKLLKLLIKEHKKVLECAARGITDGRIRGKTRDGSLPLRKLLDRYVEAGLDISRITCSKRQYQWMKKPFASNSVDPEGREYVTYSGIGVRSKSEQTIGNLLETKGIPYRYEQGFRVCVEWMEGVGRLEKEYYPDFTILTSGGKYILWEHLGLVDRPSYRSHAMEKMAAYRQSGLCDEAHLILTFEKDLKDLERLNEIVRSRVLIHM